MRNTTNATIVALAVSACIMTAVLVLLYVSAPAYAGSGPATGGEYIMITGSLSGSRDALYVFDLGVQKMNVYTFDRNAQTLNIDDQLDLKKEFKSP